MSFATQMRGVFDGLNRDYGGTVTVAVRNVTYNTRGDETKTEDWSSHNWAGGTFYNTSTDTDGVLHLGWVANMNAVPSCLTPKTNIISWVYSGGTATATETTSTHAAIFVSNSPIDLTNRFSVETRAKIDRVTAYQYFVPFVPGIVQNASQPVIAAASTFNASTRMHATPRVYDWQTFLGYRNPSDLAYHWNGASWVNTLSPAAPFVADTYYTHKIISDGTNVQWRIEDENGVLIEETTIPALLTGVKNDGNPYWLVVGDPYNNSEYGKITVDYIRAGFRNGYWISDSVPVPTSNQISDLTISYTGLSVDCFITRVDIIRASDDVIISSCTAPIATGTSTTLSSSDFDNGLSVTYEIPIKIKLTYGGSAISSAIPTVTDITGHYAYLVDAIIVTVPFNEAMREQGELNIGDVVAYFPYDTLIKQGDVVWVNNIDYEVKEIREVGVEAGQAVIYKRILLSKISPDGTSGD